MTVKVVPRPSSLVHGDAAAMETGQLLHERESNARAFMGAGSTVFDTMETLKHPGKVGLGNADAGVS